MIVRCLLIGLLFFSTGYAYAQEEDEILVEQLIEWSAGERDEAYDPEELISQLQHYRRYPLNLNTADASALEQMPFLTPLQVEQLLIYREKAGPLLSVYELQGIHGFEAGVIERLRPFVTVGKVAVLSGLAGSDKHDLMFRFGRTLETQQGYRIPDTSGRSRYLGSPERLLLRYRFVPDKRLQVALTMKKDPGEQFLAGAQSYGFDFYSASVWLRDRRAVRQLVVGDFSIQAGQGLALWTGLGYGKGAALGSMARQSGGLRPYTSSNEQQFFRGAAVTMQWKQWQVTPFLSWRKPDANVSEGPDGEPIVLSMPETGLHRTPTEVRYRQSLQQWVYGLNTEFRSRGITVGGNLFRTMFNYPIAARSELYRKYAFTGHDLTNTSTYYRFSFRNVYFFGETAHSIGSGYALVHGCLVALTRRFSLSLLHRHYNEDYHSFFSQPVAEASDAANERGFYSGVHYRVERRIEWLFYADIFSFPWLRYRVDAPSAGYDAFTQWTYTLRRQLKISVRFRHRLKQENAAVQTPEQVLADVGRSQCRVEVQYQPQQGVILRSRAEIMFYSKDGEGTERGYLWYQDVLLKPENSRFSGNARIALFRTASYNSRLYAFENHVLYGYSFPAYHLTGARAYANLRTRISRQADIWLRYATFIYKDATEIGSGLDRITGNRKSELTVQFRYRF